MKKQMIATIKPATYCLLLFAALFFTTANANSTTKHHRHTFKSTGSVSGKRDRHKAFVKKTAPKTGAAKSTTKIRTARIAPRAKTSSVRTVNTRTHATFKTTNTRKAFLAATPPKTKGHKYAAVRRVSTYSAARPQVVRAAPSAPPFIAKSSGLRLASSSALVVDAVTGKAIYAKNTRQLMPIASITKLMTAMVALDAQPSMQETLTISDADVDYLKHTTSRLPPGTRLSRRDMLRLALMSSENRAASALSRHYPGGKPAFVNAMRMKAAKLGMSNTRFNDPTGLTPSNMSTAEDLVKMVKAASQYSLIHEFTTTAGLNMAVNSVRHPLEYKNTNRLVRGGEWDIDVSKTGYIKEAGHCLVMKLDVNQRSTVMVLLESEGKLSPMGDATRLKSWMEAGGGMRLVSR